MVYSCVKNLNGNNFREIDVSVKSSFYLLRYLKSMIQITPHHICNTRKIYEQYLDIHGKSGLANNVL